MLNNNKEYAAYIRSSKWKEKRKARLEHDNNTCCVCGKPATEVHHISYERFGDEKLTDLVSLCHNCHKEAEYISNHKYFPLPMANKIKYNNFMAAMVTDAASISDEVYKYLIKTGKTEFDSLLRLRQPDDKEERKYWGVLKKAVEALCAKRYSYGYVADRTDIAVQAITDHVAVICLAMIEHRVRNAAQGSLHDTTMVLHMLYDNWKDVANDIGVKENTLKKFRFDKGISYGPQLREMVMFYCGRDAASGIRPDPNFSCLTKSDYEVLNSFADYIKELSDYAGKEEKNA